MIIVHIKNRNQKLSRDINLTDRGLFFAYYPQLLEQEEICPDQQTTRTTLVKSLPSTAVTHLVYISTLKLTGQLTRL